MNNYENITWEEFYKVLKDYRDKFFTGQMPEEKYYIEISTEINGLAIPEKATHADSILLFLNRWKCFIYQKELFINLLVNWVNNNKSQLENLSVFTIENIDLAVNSENIDFIYNSLMDFKNNGIVTMSDAAASKISHLMIPKLFLMWDKNIIKKFRYSKYSDFLLKMQKFAKNIKKEFLDRYPGKKIDDYLMESLGYSVKKPLAKYIDEYNWYLAKGYSRI